MANVASRIAVLASFVPGGLCLSDPAAAATYSVGPGQQYGSLDEIADQLEPGDVVEVDGGATYDGGVVLEAPGSEADPITIRGIRVNGQRPVFSGGTNTIEVMGNHYVLEGLELTGGESRCYFHHAHDVVLRDSVIHDCPNHGVLGADEDSGSLLMDSVEVYRCGSGDRYHQIYMTTDASSNPGSVFRMQNCYVHDGNGGNNVKSRSERNELYCNWIQGAMYHEIELIGPDDGIGTGGVREDSDVVGNVLVKDNADSFVARFGGDGTGETEGRYRFVNNTVLTQPGGGAVFRLFDALESLEAHNNVFFAVDGGTVDLIRDAEANWTSGPQLVGSNNWVGSGAENVPSEWSATLEGSDPEFSSLQGLALDPIENSPLVDAGTSETVVDWEYAVPSPWPLPNCVPPMHSVGSGAVARAVDGSVDIGAFEFGTASAGQPDIGGNGASGRDGVGGESAGTGGRMGTDGRAGTAGASESRSDGTEDSGSNDDGCDCRVNAGRPRLLALWLVAALGIAWRRHAARRR